MGKKELLQNFLDGLKARGITPENVTKEDVKDWHVHISMDNGKVQAACVDMPAVLTCDPGLPCYKDCYARHGRLGFSHNKNLRYLNLLIWKADPKRYEAEVTAALMVQRWARFNASGDMPDPKYLKMVRRVMKKCKGCDAWFMTKKAWMLNSEISSGKLPKNLHPTLSAWGEFQPENPHGVPVFHVKLKSGVGADCIPESAHHCPGDCNLCKASGHGCMNNETVWIDQHR